MVEYVSEVWLLARLDKNKRVEVLGIFKSKEVAEESSAVMLHWLRDPGWQVIGPVPLMAWGFRPETG